MTSSTLSVLTELELKIILHSTRNVYVLLSEGNSIENGNQPSSNKRTSSVVSCLLVNVVMATALSSCHPPPAYVLGRGYVDVVPMVRRSATGQLLRHKWRGHGVTNRWQLCAGVQTSLHLSVCTPVLWCYGSLRWPLFHVLVSSNYVLNGAFAVVLLYMESWWVEGYWRAYFIFLAAC